MSGAFIGCAPKVMTLDEAKQTTVSMRGKSFVPPPRRADDILDILDKEKSTHLSAGKSLHDKLQTPVPQNSSKTELVGFYMDRGRSANVVGNLQQSRLDWQKAFALATSEGGQHSGQTRDLLHLLADVEYDLGNYKEAIALLNRIDDPFVGYFYLLIKAYAASGNFAEVERTRRDGINFFESLRQKDSTSRLMRKRIEYVYLESKGKVKEAEAYYREAVQECLKHQSTRPDRVILERRKLALNLLRQQRYVEAEFEIRQVLRASVRLSGVESMHVINDMRTLADVLLAQGRKKEAKKTIVSAIGMADKLGIPKDAGSYSNAKLTLAKIHTASGDYREAVAEIEYFREKINTDPYFYNVYYCQNIDLMLAYAMADKGSEIAPIIDSAHKNHVEFLGRNHSKSLELQAIRGIVHAKLGNHEPALEDFEESIPHIAQPSAHSRSLIPAYRFQAILQSYMTLLCQLAENGLEVKLGLNASARAFEISSLLENQVVQKAILESSTRMAVDDDKLLELIRNEQDVQLQIDAYQNLIQSLLARPTNERDNQVIHDIKHNIERLSSARDVLGNEILKQFPDYAHLVHPRVPRLEEVQRLLRADEVLVSICSTDNNTFVWAVPRQGRPAMARIAMTYKELQERILNLKSSIVPSSDILGQIPEFDFQAAFELYTILLKPVEPAWNKFHHLIFATTGPVGQIPVYALPTSPFKMEKDAHGLFSSYRKAPWLLRTHTVTMVPSVSSFMGLRTLPVKAPAREAFAGFGDPYFNTKQMSEALSGKWQPTDKPLSMNSKLNVRGIRLTEGGTLDSDKIMSCRIESLKRLPDTADEIRSIAEALGADSSRDVYLGLRATEKLVKTMDLSGRRVVAFASHALVPYDLDGLAQPAIALSAPSVTGDDDDGLLTMEEILELKLNADWVVLSACNTGAAQGAGAEAISGLGRAFFYAGTKAILVSLWPVETSSAKKLTTSIFRHQRDMPKLSRAAAHQRSILDLINDPGIVNENGVIVASYAHPFFWAPFIIVGDNGIRDLN